MPTKGRKGARDPVLQSGRQHCCTFTMKQPIHILAKKKGASQPHDSRHLSLMPSLLYPPLGCSLSLLAPLILSNPLASMGPPWWLLGLRHCIERYMLKNASSVPHTILCARVVEGASPQDS